MFLFWEGKKKGTNRFQLCLEHVNDLIQKPARLQKLDSLLVVEQDFDELAAHLRVLDELFLVRHIAKEPLLGLVESDDSLDELCPEHFGEPLRDAKGPVYEGLDLIPLPSGDVLCEQHGALLDEGADLDRVHQRVDLDLNFVNVDPHGELPLDLEGLLIKDSEHRVRFGLDLVLHNFVREARVELILTFKK